MAIKGISGKEFWRVYGIFVGILVFFFMSLFGMMLLARKPWTNGLKKTIETVLEEKDESSWIVGKRIPLHSTFDSSAVLFDMRASDSVEKNYVLLLRSATMYGHIPAVFIYNKNSGARFVGYSSVRGRVRALLDEGTSDSSIQYWISRIPLIIQTAEELSEAKK